MDHHLGPRRDDGIAQGLAIEHVDYDCLGALRFQSTRLIGRAGRAAYVMSGGKEERRQPPADNASRSGKKNPHGDVLTPRP